MPDEQPKTPEMIQAFRRIEIVVDGGEELGIVRVEVPFDLALLDRFETALQKCEDAGWKWIRLKRSDKTIVAAFREFCGHYLPEEIDVERAQPDFCALFFSRVKAELIASMSVSMASIISTVTP